MQEVSYFGAKDGQDVRQTSTMATLQLATWATGLTYANLTTGVVDAAVKSLYNWAGCAIGGVTIPSVAIK